MLIRCPVCDQASFALTLMPFLEKIRLHVRCSNSDCSYDTTVAVTPTDKRDLEDRTGLVAGPQLQVG